MEDIWQGLDLFKEGLIPRKCSCGQNLWHGSIVFEDGEYERVDTHQIIRGKQLICPNCNRIYFCLAEYRLPAFFRKLYRWLTGGDVLCRVVVVEFGPLLQPATGQDSQAGP